MQAASKAAVLPQHSPSPAITAPQGDRAHRLPRWDPTLTDTAHLAALPHSLVGDVYTLLLIGLWSAYWSEDSFGSHVLKILTRTETCCPGDSLPDNLAQEINGKVTDLGLHFTCGKTLSISRWCGRLWPCPGSSSGKLIPLLADHLTLLPKIRSKTGRSL